MKLYNSLTRCKEEFTPQNPHSVSMYVCGITPYDTTHLGHAFTYIFFDVLNRYLQYKGHTVVYTQNVTDINDRDNDILKRAKEQNVPWEQLADYWTKKFLGDMEKLNWIHPTNYLHASEEIDSMIALIKKILENDAGYEVNGGIYLDIKKFSQYGKLSRLNTEQMIARAREFEEDLDNPDKKNPLDITLWRPSTKHQPSHIPSFESPWGKGRPGWHLECSAMSISSLGEQIDIHGGGMDLIFPHHEGEIAQSELATQKSPFSKFWLHTGTVMYAGEKMSKSLGNLVLISELLKSYSPNAIRWLLLSFYWREPWEYREEELAEAEEKLKMIGEALKKDSSQPANLAHFEKIMDDDMYTPRALEYLCTLAQHINDGTGGEIATLRKSLEVLGFLI